MSFLFLNILSQRKSCYPFLWCKKGPKSSKIVIICTPNDTTKKFMDGVGATSIDRTEEVLGESDNGHTVEDSVKLTECACRLSETRDNRRRRGII